MLNLYGQARKTLFITRTSKKDFEKKLYCVGFFMDLSLQAFLEYARLVEVNKGAYVLHYHVRSHKLKQGTYAGKL